MLPRRRASDVSGLRVSRYGRAARTSSTGGGGGGTAGFVAIEGILGAVQHDWASDGGSVHPDDDARQRARVPCPGDGVPGQGDSSRPAAGRNEELDVVRQGAQDELLVACDEVAGAAGMGQLVDAPPR